MKRHQTNWSNLPTEVVRSIAGCLEEYADDLHNFRRTCKKWRQSTAISTILPLTINSTPRRKLYYSSVSLLRPRSHGDVPSSAYSPWMISAIETTNGNLQCCHPFNKTPLLAEGSLCEEFQSINLDRAYHLTQVDDEDEEVIEFDKVLLLSNRRVPSGDECGLLALHSGGRLGGYLSLEIDCELTWSEIKYRSITKFDDIIMYKGMILALTRQGKVYTIDENRLKVDSTLVDHPLSQVGRPRYRGCRRRLVNSNSLPKKLYLVERVSQCSFRVYNLHQEKMGNKWVEVKSFGENVLFVTRDYCFFVSASQFSTCCLKNCIVFSNDGFPRYGSGRTNWERSDPTKIFVFRVGGHSDYNFKPISRFTGFPLFLWSCPPWAWDKGSSSSCQFQSNNSTIKFKGLDIRSNFLQTLQNIWSKHGNLIENSLIRNGDMVSRALESLAQAILILEQTSVQSLSDSQVDYLKSTLSDLQCMRFKVDWLVPYVDKAVQLHKSKPLIDSRDQLLSCKAKVQERRSKLYEELAELDKLEKELEEDVANASKFIPVSGNVDMDQPIGWGLS
ncbi:hypothetical protein RDABS01_018837 [Bienertia sinuspersici]